MQFSMPESSQRAAEALPEGAVREPPCTDDARPPGTWARGGCGGGRGAQKPASVHHRCTKKDGASGGGDEANDNRRACGVDGWLVRALLSARQPLVRHPPRHSLHLCGSRPASRGYVLLMYSPRNISSRGRLAATKVQAVAGVSSRLRHLAFRRHLAAAEEFLRAVRATQLTGGNSRPRHKAHDRFQALLVSVRVRSQERCVASHLI